ncbi:MAG TPA: hypothetical protein VK806_14275 [Bacteroidia bacterium]|jgi:hypothetical protein|nr:hypothetical protein [Bacteroidia bacterium]
MSKSKTMQLTIPKPCTEGWDNMTPNERGRHCQSCNKTVVDFSTFTDKQLVEFFSKIAHNVCGRFNNFQLERQLVYVEPSRHQFLNRLLFGTAFTAGIIGSANANYNPNNKPLIERLGNQENSNKWNKQESGNDSVRGVVMDSKSKQSLPFAAVTLLLNDSTQIGFTQTGIDGSFSMNVPQQYIGKKVELLIVYAGYNDRKMKIVAGANKALLKITLKEIPQKLEFLPIHTTGLVEPNYNGLGRNKKDTLKK